MPLMQLVAVSIKSLKDAFVVNEVVRDGPDAVTPAEVEMLRQIHGSDNVFEIKHVGMIDRDPLYERDRLRRRYGRKAETAKLADQLFPGSRATVPMQSYEIACPPLDEHEQDEARPELWHYVPRAKPAAPEAHDEPAGDLDGMSDDDLKDEFRQRGLRVPTGPVKRETLIAKLKAGANAD